MSRLIKIFFHQFNFYLIIKSMLICKLLDKIPPSIFCVAFKHIKTGSLKIRNQKMSSKLEAIPKVDIDASGVFKYILLKVHDDEDKSDRETFVTVVRGYKRCNYHSDIYDEVQEKLKPLDCEPLGGGRISHDPETKLIQIYGYSQGYGKADHEVAAKLIKEKYPGYKITVSDEGY